MKWKVLAIAVLLAGGAVAVAASLGLLRPASTAAGAELLTATAAVSDITDEVAATGSVAPTDTWELAFGSPGSTIAWPVATVAVKVGDRVAKGAILATADLAALELAIGDATRMRKSANIQLALANTELADAATTAAIRQARIAVYGAESAAAKAVAAEADLKAQLDLATLVAPADGVITAVNIEAGRDAPASPAITLASAALEVTTSVVESDIASISVGQPASITIAALGASVDGFVASIGPAGTASGNGGVVSFAVAVTLADPPTGLRAGMSADVTITTATATGVLAIPARALSGSAGAYTARVVADDGTVSRRNIGVGLLTASLAEITSGLQAGERVVTGTSSTQSTTQQGGGLQGGGFQGGGGGVLRAP